MKLVAPIEDGVFSVHVGSLLLLSAYLSVCLSVCLPLPLPLPHLHSRLSLVFATSGEFSCLGHLCALNGDHGRVLLCDHLKEEAYRGTHEKELRDREDTLQGARFS